MALDQVLEQLNCKIKAVLGGLNLLNKDDEGKSLFSWALSCPQILRLLEEYEKKPNAGTTEHLSNYKQLQLDYKGDCLKFKSSWMCCLCPFLDSTPAETLYYAPTMKDHSLTTRYWWSRWMPCCHLVSSKAWTTPTTDLFCIRRLSQPLFQKTVSFYQAMSYPQRRHS